MGSYDGADHKRPQEKVQKFAECTGRYTDPSKYAKNNTSWLRIPASTIRDSLFEGGHGCSGQCKCSMPLPLPPNEFNAILKLRWYFGTRYSLDEMSAFMMSPQTSLVAFVVVSLVQAVFFMAAPEVLARSSASLPPNSAI